MSCAYRTHRYRASVTARPASVSWGHVHHPIPLRPPVVRPNRQVVLATADDAPIPVSLVQYLWSRWQKSPPDVRDAVTAAIGNLMRSPRWHWDVTVLPDHAPTNPSNPCVIERDGRPTIGIPTAMLQELWRWVLGNTDQRAPILRWFASGITPSLWQELHTDQQAHVSLTEQAWYPLYGYLSPVLLPDIAHTAHDLLSSADPDDHQMALTMLEQWLASDDHATRDLATQMLSTWLHARPADGTVTDARWMSLLGKMVRDHPSDAVIREVLDRLMPAILPSAHPDDRIRWAATLWNLMTDSTLSDARRQTIARALTPMMQDPMVAARVHAQVCTDPSLLQTIPAPIGDTLLASLIHTAHADAVLSMIAQEIRQNPSTIARFDRIVAAGWGNGHDHRILQIIDSVPGPHWHTVLTEGVTTSVGAEVCERIQSWFPRDHGNGLIAYHIHDREERGDWPLAPLPTYLIPWVGDAARTCPSDLHPTTIRRLWLADPVQAWNVTQAILDSDDPFVQQRALAAMDAGWGRGHDDTIAATLLPRILNSRSWSTIESGIATAVAGIGTAPPAIIASLLTELATGGNTNVQRWLISALRHGWGRGQDALVLRVVAIIAKREESWEWIWAEAHETLIRAWDHLPPHVVRSLIDQLLTHVMNGLVNEKKFEKWFGRVSMAKAAIAAFAPGWAHLPTAHMIERIAHHVAHLCAHADDPAISRYRRDTLISAWARVIAAGAEHVSAADVHALLGPLWDLSPHGCLTGIEQGVRR
jgi:hypothetical protein